jgi:hypothetical protein
MHYAYLSTMVEVFKTNIQDQLQSQQVLCVLSDAFPSFKINFDLTDCDKILRVEGHNLDVWNIITLVHQRGFRCEVLDT